MISRALGTLYLVKKTDLRILDQENGCENHV